MVGIATTALIGGNLSGTAAGHVAIAPVADGEPLLINPDGDGRSGGVHTGDAEDNA